MTPGDAPPPAPAVVSIQVERLNHHPLWCGHRIGTQFFEDHHLARGRILRNGRLFCSLSCAKVEITGVGEI